MFQPFHRAAVTAVALLLAVAGLTGPADGATRPGAPAPCSASKTTDGYHVTWSRPSNDGGGVIWRYVIRVKYLSSPVVRLSAPNRRTEYDGRSYEWTHPVVGDPPVFRVRAVNTAGPGRWCNATATGTVDEPAPEPDPEPQPDPEPPAVDTGPLPYTADSFFKSRVDGPGVPIDEARTSLFHREMATHPDQGGRGITWPKVNVNPNWAMSYHVGKASDPIWRIVPKPGQTFNRRLDIAQTQGFHMADSVAETFPDGDQDRPGLMIDPVFGYSVQFADAVPNLSNRTISVTGPGILWHSSNGLDYRNPRSNDERNFTSRGRVIDAMVVRRDLLDRAMANGTGLGHVLHLFLMETNTADGFVHPMVGAESGKSGFGAEGERIRIRPDVNLEARGLTGAALALARTMKEHGAYIGDNSGSSTQIKASQPHHYLGTNLTTDVFKGKLTWDDFQVVQRGWQ